MDFAAGIAVGMFVCVVVLASCAFWASRFVDAYEAARDEEDAARIAEEAFAQWRAERELHANLN